jgi:hypothetical protein
MNTARTLGTSAAIIALALALVGCNPASEAADKVSTVEMTRPLNTEVCNTASWIRDHAPAGLCESTPVVDDEMSLRRLREERRQ